MAASVANELAGRAGNAVQAMNVYGGVRFYGPPGPPRRRTVPRQLLRPEQRFTNRDVQMDLLTDRCLMGPASTEPACIALLVGPPGVGKTALACYWASGKMQQFPDGQLYVDLRGHGHDRPLDPQEALAQFLRALGIPDKRIPADPGERAALYRSEVAGQRLLILLDNAASVRQVRPLLPAGPGPLVLVTSRRELTGLTLREAAVRVPVDVLGHEHSSHLLRSTLSASGAERWQDEDLERLVRVCAGLPLALALTAEHAARAPVCLKELAEQMEDETRRLDAMASHEEPELAVRSSLRSSYLALPAEQAAFFRSIAGYLGPDFSPGAGAALAGVDLADAVGYMRELVEIHLVEPASDRRYRMHDLVRLYAVEVASTEEKQQAADRLLHWYAHSALTAAKALGTASLPVALPEPPGGVQALAFAGDAEALSWFEAERASLLEAVSRASLGMGTLAWQLPAALLGLYMTTNAFDDWLQANTAGSRAANASGDPEARAAMAESAGKAARQKHQLAQAAAHLAEAYQLRIELADARGQARVVNVLGLVEAAAERWQPAVAHFTAAIEAASNIPDADLVAFARINLGWALCETGRHAEALPILDQAAEALRTRSRPVQLANALKRRGTALRGLNRLNEALASAHEAVELCQRLGSHVHLAQALHETGLCIAASGENDRALELLDQALEIHQRLGDRWREAAVHTDAASIQRSAGRENEAVTQYTAAARLYRMLGEETKATECDRRAHGKASSQG